MSKYVWGIWRIWINSQQLGPFLSIRQRIGHVAFRPQVSRSMGKGTG